MKTLLLLQEQAGIKSPHLSDHAWLLPMTHCVCLYLALILFNFGIFLQLYIIPHNQGVYSVAVKQERTDPAMLTSDKYLSLSVRQFPYL